MADIELVIKIPKECIPTRQDVMNIQLHFVDGKVVEASGYGFAVLPEHGRLIDADALNNQIQDNICSKCDSNKGLRCRACQWDDEMGDLLDAPTILEAWGNEE